MNRDKNGRFSKKSNIEIPIPTFLALFKFVLLGIIFLPWIYVIFFRLNIQNAIEHFFELLFGYDEEKCFNEETKQKTPYK